MIPKRRSTAARIAATALLNRPRHGDFDRPERAGDPSLAMTVPVTGERRDIGRLGDRRAVGRAGFAIAAPLPAFVPSSSQRGGQFLLDQLLDETPDPISNPRLDRIRRSVPQKQLRFVFMLSVVMT